MREIYRRQLNAPRIQSNRPTLDGLAAISGRYIRAEYPSAVSTFPIKA